MLPNNLQRRMRNGDANGQPWDEIISDRNHPSPSHGKPFAQMRPTLYGPSTQHHSEDRFRPSVTPTLFGSLTDQFRSQVKTSSFAQSKLSGIDRKEPLTSYPQAVEPGLASKVKSTNLLNDADDQRGTYDANDLDDSEDDGEDEDIKDDHDDVFVKPHSNGHQRATLRLPNRAYLRRSLGGTSQKARDDQMLARSRSFDSDCLISGSKKSRSTDEAISGSGVNKSWQEVSKYKSQLGLSSPIPAAVSPPPVSSRRVSSKENHPTDIALRSTSHNLFSRSFLPSPGPSDGRSEMKEAFSDDSGPVANAVDLKKSARRNNEIAKNIPVITRVFHSDKDDSDDRGDDSSSNPTPDGAIDQRDESNDSIPSDFASDFFGTSGKGAMKTFSLGDDYVIDDGQPPAPPLTNFLERSLENVGVALPSTSFLSSDVEMKGSLSDRQSSSDVDDGKSIYDATQDVEDAQREQDSEEEIQYPSDWHSSWGDKINAARQDYQAGEGGLTARFNRDPDCSGNHLIGSDSSMARYSAPFNWEVQSPVRVFDSSDDDEKERLDQLRSFARNRDSDSLKKKTFGLIPNPTQERLDYSPSDEMEHLKPLRSSSRTQTSSSPRYARSPAYSDSESDDDSYDQEDHYYSTEERARDGYGYDDYYDTEDDYYDDNDDFEVVEPHYADADDVEEDDGNVTEVLSDDSDACDQSVVNPSVSDDEGAEVGDSYDIIKRQVYEDAKELVDELINHVGSKVSEETAEPVEASSGSLLSDEDLEDVVVLFLSDILNDVDPSLRFTSEQTSAYNNIYYQVANRRVDQVLVADRALEVSVTRCSLKTLIEEVPAKQLTAKSHVNDEVINSYMSLIRHRSNINPDLPRVFVFNTFFYESLRNGGHERVKRWTRGKDLFSYDMIVVPLNFKSEHHWALFIIDLSAKVFVHYDSLLNRDLAKFKKFKLTKQIRIFAMFREYIEKEIIHKNSNYDLDPRSFAVDFCARFPQQRNLIGKC